MPGRERHSQGRHGEEVAVSGASKSTIGREEPRTAHALHTSHTLVIRRPCQKCRFWLCRSRRGGRHSAFLTGSLVMLMSLALRTNLGLWGCLPVLPWPLRWGLAWDLWHRLGMRSVVRCSVKEVKWRLGAQDRLGFRCESTAPFRDHRAVKSASGPLLPPEIFL